MTAASHADAGAADLRAVLEAVGRDEGAEGSWFTRLVVAYLRYRDARPRPAAAAGSEVERAQAVIRAACIKSAIGGTASGLVLTGATLFTAEAPVLGVITIPVAALGIGGEMIARSLIHLDMTCDLAEVFGQRFDPADTTDFWQVYGLAFRAVEHERPDDPGRDLVHRIGEAEVHEIGESIGHKLLGESVLKNIVPFLGVATASLTNWRRTRALGDTVRRYLRYRRAIGDTMQVAEALCADQLDVLIEGVWFLFIADGRLLPEEAALLSGLLRRLDPIQRAAVEARFVTDEEDWLARLPSVPPDVREPLFGALEVAAAVDKSVSLPEQKILARAARALGRPFDRNRVDEMIRAFTMRGVLAGPTRDGRGEENR